MQTLGWSCAAFTRLSSLAGERMTTIANNISLVTYSGTIFDQQAEGSCVACQICGAIALQANEYGAHIPELSSQQLYNDTRSFI
jgi:hypothetical protein